MPMRPLLLAFLLLAAAPALTTPARAQDYECDNPVGWKPTEGQPQSRRQEEGLKHPGSSQPPQTDPVASRWINCRLVFFAPR